MSTPTAATIFSNDFAWYWTLTIFAIGLIGNTINILIFTTLKLFRGNQCVFYLTIENIVNNLQLITISLIYILRSALGYDPAFVSLLWCKLRNILPQFFRLMSTTMICLAVFDQYLATNHRPGFRQYSSLNIALRFTVGSMILWLLHSVPYAVYINIVSNSSCINTNVILVQYYSSFYYPFLHGLFPILLSSSLSLLSYHNVRHIVRRQIPIVRRRLDRQLTAMVFIRVIIFVILQMPYTIYRIYSLNMTISQQSEHLQDIDRLVSTLTTSLSNLNTAVS